MTLIRNIVFAIVFYGLSVPIVLATPVSALFGRRAVVANATLWTRVHAWCVRWLLGIRVVVEGAPSPEPTLYAAKHQAMWETLELQWRLAGAAMVLKRELANIPVWGWAAMRYGAIAVDREASAAALRQMMKAGAAARALGRSVFIFPEGTRVAPGEAPPLKSGFAGLYRALGMPVVPVSHDRRAAVAQARTEAARHDHAAFRRADPGGAAPRRDRGARPCRDERAGGVRPLSRLGGAVRLAQFGAVGDGSDAVGTDRDDPLRPVVTGRLPGRRALDRGDLDRLGNGLAVAPGVADRAQEDGGALSLGQVADGGGGIVGRRGGVGRGRRVARRAAAGGDDGQRDGGEREAGGGTDHRRFLL